MCIKVGSNSNFHCILLDTLSNMTIYNEILTLKILNSNMFEYEKKTLNVTLIEITV